jgi:hypothetical protein
VGASPSHNPMGLHGLLQRQIYRLYYYINILSTLRHNYAYYHCVICSVTATQVQTNRCFDVWSEETFTVLLIRLLLTKAAIVFQCRCVGWRTGVGFLTGSSSLSHPERIWSPHDFSTSYYLEWLYGNKIILFNSHSGAWTQN